MAQQKLQKYEIPKEPFGHTMKDRIIISSPLEKGKILKQRNPSG